MDDRERSVVKLLVGLGNPGERYHGTRHNVGFRFVDKLADSESIRFRRRYLPSAWVGSLEIEGETVLLVKPKTFMNRSGKAVAGLLRRYGLTIDDLIVVYDDVALEVGRLRVRQRGSAGGHNGVQSVIDWLDADNFVRIRIGVGGSPRQGGLIDHVLGGFTPEEEKSIEVAIARARDLTECLLCAGVEQAMNNFNRSDN